jgi:hypothetical protein
VNASSDGPTGVAILRVWRDRRADRRVRIRVTRTTDLSVGSYETSATTEIDGACSLVRAWLEDFVRGRS